MTNKSVENFLKIWQNKAVCSVLYDLQGNVLAMNEQTIKESEFASQLHSINKNFANVETADLEKIIMSPEFADITLNVCRKVARLQQITIEEMITVNAVLLIPRQGEFRIRLINYIPVFDDEGKVVAIQEFINRFRLFGPTECLRSAQNLPIQAATKMDTDALELPIKLSNRQHEVLFLLCRDLPQEFVAEMLRISRSTISSMIVDVLCPKFGIEGSNTKELVAKAVEMKYHLKLPNSLCRPFAVPLDYMIQEKYFPDVTKTDVVSTW